jgi:CBS domain-containing protein
MSTKVVTIGPAKTVEDAATLMHDHKVSRVPVVDTTGRLVGLLSRGDIVRAMVLGVGEPPASAE